MVTHESFCPQNVNTSCFSWTVKVSSFKVHSMSSGPLEITSVYSLNNCLPYLIQLNLRGHFKLLKFVFRDFKSFGSCKWLSEINVLTL